MVRVPKPGVFISGQVRETVARVGQVQLSGLPVAPGGDWVPNSAHADPMLVQEFQSGYERWIPGVAFPDAIARHPRLHLHYGRSNCTGEAVSIMTAPSLRSLNIAKFKLQRSNRPAVAAGYLTT